MQKCPATSHRKSYCLYTEKPPQAVASPVLNPNSRTFWSGGKDSADRTTPPPGNSVCRDGRSSCRACYTGACRSRPGRTTTPDAISCSGSKVAHLRGLLLRGGLVRAFPFRALTFRVLQPLPDGRLFLRCGPARLDLGFLQFLPTAAVVDDPVNHAILSRCPSYTSLKLSPVSRT